MGARRPIRFLGISEFIHIADKGYPGVEWMSSLAI